MVVSVAESVPPLVLDAGAPEPARARRPDALSVVDTTELRWFFVGSLPAGIREWFAGSGGRWWRPPPARKSWCRAQGGRWGAARAGSREVKPDMTLFVVDRYCSGMADVGMSPPSTFDFQRLAHIRIVARRLRPATVW